MNGWKNHPKSKRLKNRFFEGPKIYDYAIAELEDTVTYTKAIAPVCLPPQNAHYVGKMTIVSGWGTTENGGTYPDKLRTTNVTILSKIKCEVGWIADWGQHFGEDYRPDTMLCAADMINFAKDSCRGDSGGMHIGIHLM